MTRGILLVGHGTREPAGTAQFLALADRVAALVPELAVVPAFLDYATPGIQAGLEQLVNRGARAVVILPLLLFAAGHAKQDLPAHLALARQRHPQVTLSLAPVLGMDPDLVRLCARHLPPDSPDTAVLLVGRGSSDPEANEGLVEVVRLLRQAYGSGTLTHAYCDVASPSVAEGLECCLASGARRVVMLPYLLFRGVLMDRLAVLLTSCAAANPNVAFDLAGALGLADSPGFAELVLSRIKSIGP